MNGEGQRPPAPPEPAQASSSDAPEPGNARYPQQPGINGNGQQFGQGQEGQPGGGGGGRRRFRRNRRGGRGRRGKGGGQNPSQPPPLDAQGRILDVENDFSSDEGGPEDAPLDGAQAPAPGAAPASATAPGPEGQPSPEGAPLNLDSPPQPQPQQQPQQNRPAHQQRHGQQQPRQQQQPRHEAAQPIEGVLEIDHRGNGRLRNPKLNFLPQQDDPDVPRHMIERDHLRAGVLLTGQAVRRNGRLQLIKTETVEGLPPQEASRRTAFQNLTVIDPDDRVVLETTSKELLTRVIDIVAPIGLGQRMLIVAPPKTGKTIMLQKICHAITQNRPEVQQMVLLVEAGKDVVILLDSITRLSRAYNKEVESSGRTLSGGIDSRALERPKRFFGAARNAEEGGSLTIVATALIDTGSRMDEVIFEEFKGTGNSEINLDRQLAEKRIFPAINIQTSGTRKEEKLFSQHEYEKVKKLRGALFALKPVEAMERLLKSLNEFKSNAEFLDAI